MHIGEERFHVIRMSTAEYAAVSADIDLMMEDTGVDLDQYPSLSRFCAAVGWCREQGTEVVQEQHIVFEFDEEAVADADDD